MSLSLTWLTLLQPTLSIIVGLIFLVTSFLCLSLIRPRRKAAPILQSIGFLLLAVPYSLTFTGLFSSAVAAPIILAAALFIVSGLILTRLRIAPAAPVTPETVVKAKVASAMRTTSPYPSTDSDAKPSPTQKAVDHPSSPKESPTPPIRTAIAAKSGLRSEPLVKLPALKRKRARQFVNILIGFFVFFLIGWGSYVIAKRIIQPPATPSLNNYEPLSSPSTVDASESPTLTPSPTDENTSPSPTSSTPPTPTPSDESTDTVTIKDTETGYLNVREGASTATAIITTIDPGTTHKLLDTSTNNEWYKIELDDGNAGWIATKYADKQAAE